MRWTVFTLACIALCLGSFTSEPAQARAVFRIFTATAERLHPKKIAPFIQQWNSPGHIRQNRFIARNQGSGWFGSNTPRNGAGTSLGTGPQTGQGTWPPQGSWRWILIPGTGTTPGTTPRQPHPPVAEIAVVPLPTSIQSLLGAFFLLVAWKRLRQRTRTGAVP